MTIVLKSGCLGRPTRVLNQDLPEITAIPGDEIDNIKIEHGNGTKYANQKMGESI